MISERYFPISMAQQRQLRSRRHWDKLMYWFAFFMAFPSIVIIQNISIYIFISIVFFALRRNMEILSLKHITQWMALVFGLGAILSVMNMPHGYADDSVGRALQVLPNYLYWCILIVFLVAHREKLDLELIFKAVFWGVIASVIYFFILQRIGLLIFPIFKRFSQNTFAFLIICYAPIATYYAKKKYGNKKAFAFSILLVLVGFISGSRSSSILVLFGSFSALFSNYFRLKYIFPAMLFVYLFGSSFLQIPVIKETILALNPRTYNLIYNYKTVLTEDRSYLIRVAMVKKGLAIYNDYPYTGIGLNNFSNYKAKISGDFKGSKFVIQKSDINTTSAHNSYIGILGEGGLLLLFPLVGLLLYNMFFFIQNANVLSDSKRSVFIGLIAMSIHLYFIMAIVNVFAWFLIALACAISSKGSLK